MVLYGISKRDMWKTLWKSECVVPIEMMKQSQYASQIQRCATVSWDSEEIQRGKAEEPTRAKVSGMKL